MDLTELQLRYGITHLKTHDPKQRSVVELAQSHDDTKLTINCTQRRRFWSGVC